MNKDETMVALMFSIWILFEIWTALDIREAGQERISLLNEIELLRERIVVIEKQTPSDPPSGD